MSTGQQEAADAVVSQKELSHVGKIEGIPIPRLNFKSSSFNFESWCMDIELAFDIIDGLWDIVFDPPAMLNPEQKKLDKKAYAYLGYAVGEDGKDLLCPRKETSGALWKKIVGRFGRKLLSKELQSLESFLKLSMSSDICIVEYVAKCESAWNEYLTVSGWREDMSNMSKEMKLCLEHIFFLKLLSGISSHPERLYGVQLQTLHVQLSEDKLTLNSVVDLISMEEEAVNNARGDIQNQIAFASQVISKSRPFTCHNCGSPDHFFRNCDTPLHANLKSIVNSRSNPQKPIRFKNKKNLLGKTVQKEVSSTSESSDEKEDEQQAGSVCIIGEASNAVITDKRDENSSIFDSGASHPFFLTTKPFSRYISLRNVFVKVANGVKVPITHVGEARIQVFVDGVSKELVYKKAFVVPSLDQNLLLMSKLRDNGYTFCSDLKTRSILITNSTTGELICRAPERNSVFPLCRETWHGATAYSVKNVLSSSSYLWHLRFGHLHHQGLQHLTRKGMVKHLKPEMVAEPFECEACIQGKHPKTPYFPSESSMKEIGELVHSDVCGPLQVRSWYGRWYIVSFIDDFSSMVRSYAIRSKDQVTVCFQKFIDWLKRETGKSIKRIRSDRGGEYVGSEFQKLLTKEGISQQLTVGYAPPQNCKAERWNRTLVDGIRTVLIDSGLPLSFWEDAMEYVVFTRNRSPTASKKKVPFHLFYKRKPNVKYLRRFGTKAYANIGKSHKQKLDPLNTPVVILGYQEGVKGYKVLDLKTGRVTQMDQVVFIENDRVSLTDINKIPAPSGQPIVIISREKKPGYRT